MRMQELNAARLRTLAHLRSRRSDAGDAAHQRELSMAKRGVMLVAQLLQPSRCAIVAAEPHLSRPPLDETSSNSFYARDAGITASRCPSINFKDFCAVCFTRTQR